MQIIKEDKEGLNAVLKVQVEKTDYAENVEKVLKDYRKKARIDGFRPGKVPMGLMRKMYGKSVIVEEVNKLISEKVSSYIQDEKLNILGEPLPSDEQKPIDFDHQENFEFAFDVALSPEFDLQLSKRYKLTYYHIKPDKKMIDQYVENYQRQYAAMKEGTKASEESYIHGNLIELNEEESPRDAGLDVSEAKLSVSLIKDDDIKKTFLGAEKGQIINFDVKKAYPNDFELSNLLGIKKEELEEIQPNFQLSIDAIQDVEPAEIGQELFDKAFGEGEINSEKEFRERISKDAEASFEKESEYKLIMDARDKLLKKTEMELPEEFLKRWLLSVNKELTKDKIEEDWPRFLEDMNWQLIKNKIIKENELQVSEEELIEAAKEYTRMQFMQYGMNYVPEEHLTKYAAEFLKKDEERRQIEDRELEKKVAHDIKDKVKIEEKDISPDDFNALIQKSK